MNGKEFPKNSFEKFTAKSLVTKMKHQNDPELKNYEVRASDRKYNIWLRDPLAVRIFSKEMLKRNLIMSIITRYNPIGIYVRYHTNIAFHPALFT
jgi:hypothetical protein